MVLDVHGVTVLARAHLSPRVIPSARVACRRTLGDLGGMRARDCLLLLALLLAGSKSAWAEEPRVLVVLTPGGNARLKEALTRLRAELVTAGFEVVEVGAHDDREASDQTAEAAATLSVVATRSGARTEAWDVEVRVPERGTRVGVTTRSHIAPPRSPRESRALAIRIVELLRANLIEPAPLAPTATPPAAETSRPPQTGEPTLAPTNQTPVAPKSEPIEPLHHPQSRDRPVSLQLQPSQEVPPFGRLYVEAGAGALMSPGGLPVAFVPRFAVSLAVSRSWSLGASWLGPAFGRDLQTAEGSLRVTQEMAMLELAYLMRLPFRSLVPRVAVNGGGYHLRASGNAVEPYTSAVDDDWAVVAGAGFGVAVRVSDHFGFVGDARGEIAWPRPIVAAVGQHVAESGRPSVLTTIGVLIGL